MTSLNSYFTATAAAAIAAVGVGLVGCDAWAARETQKKAEPLYSQHVRSLQLDSVAMRAAVEAVMASVEQRAPVSLCAKLKDRVVSLSTPGTERLDEVLGRLALAAGATRFTKTIAVDPGSIGRPYVMFWCSPEDQGSALTLDGKGQWHDPHN